MCVLATIAHAKAEHKRCTVSGSTTLTFISFLKKHTAVRAQPSLPLLRSQPEKDRSTPSCPEETQQSYSERRHFIHPLNDQIPMTSPSSLLCLLKYSGFQQSADKCNTCGHLIMDMVSVSAASPQSALRL